MEYSYNEMRTIRDVIRRALEVRTNRGYEYIFWAIDLHDTIIEGKYNRFNDGARIFPFAKEVLDRLYNSNIHRTILWTSSHQDAMDEILKRFDLRFHYINENPKCKSDKLCDFSKKFYFNILLDDKSAFDASTDWEIIKDVLDDYENKG